MKGIKETWEKDKPREKLARMGAEMLSDRELIAAIIGKGVPGRDVFAVSKDIEEMITESDNNGNSLTCKGLTSLHGVGTTKACQIVAAFELARRHITPAEEKRLKITCPGDLMPVATPLLNKKQEYFVCITLNGAGEMIKNRVITVGLLNHSPVHPREVYADAITDRAASVIFLHNHPSGNPEPSPQDVDITKQLIKAGDILGIKVLDHIVVAKRGNVSLRERGLI